MTIFYLIRHGNVNRLGDVSDPPLTAPGLAEADSVAQHLARIEVDHVFASPLRRAQETAAIIAKPHALPVIEDPRLRERANFGDLPGQPLDEFIAMWKRCNNERDRQPPVGDSSIGCGQRVEAFVTDCDSRVGWLRPLSLRATAASSLIFYSMSSAGMKLPLFILHWRQRPTVAT